MKPALPASILAMACFTHSLWGQMQDSTSLPSRELRLEEVVVSASRLQESGLKSPVSIEKATVSDFRRSAQPSFFDALENIKGVHLIVPSLGFKVLNTRGFANTTNVRFAQLIDGIDNQSPHIGAPVGNALGPSDLDIVSVEIIPGTASALYGMNAINGLADFQTKSPFDRLGLSFQQKSGINHLNDRDVGPKLFNESSLRYAHARNDRWAFKVNGTFTKGYDWQATDRTDITPKINASAGLTGTDNPAYDPVSSFGNESANRRTLTLAGRNIVVARTGYDETDVVDYHFQNLKGDAALHFRPVKAIELSYTYRIAYLNNVYQRSNRFQLAYYLLQQHALQLRGRAFQLRAYMTSENTGQSYNLRSMAENMDRLHKSDNQWFADFQTRFRQVQNASSLADALREARTFADAGRPQPGTAAFQSNLARLQDINNWDAGAALRVKANLYHAEGQWNLTEEWLQNWRRQAGVELLAGFDHRTYAIVPDGNYFINPVSDTRNLTYGKTGGFLQATKVLSGERLKLGATLRADKADYFRLKLNPRFTAVYSVTESHHFRASYQSGYRFPSIFEGFSNIKSGGVKRVGGLPVMSQGIFENSYLRTSIDAFQAAVNAGVNKVGVGKRDSLVKANLGLLQRNTYTYLRPEFIRSLEMGYKGMFFQKRLLVDADFYYNRYRDFMAQVEANIPNASTPDSLGQIMLDRTKQQRYRLWTNSKTIVHNYGASLGLRYRLHRGWVMAVNATYTQLDRKEANDGLEDGFNTPRWMTNVSVSHANLFKNIGFGLSYKHQSQFDYQSFLVNGNVPAINVFDGQMTYSFPQQKVDVKLGGTNLLNRYYFSILGGPQIGSFYYLTLTYR
ncbi:TonB-dependent receptor [Runella slithyformis]|uniref:TonB-dependent receptor n=1 Tax=Runella slithyformis (strain ATCC 29530 / DSM 19594 / LMG 11500 / NCIMB 11436 / LSU 4) TaxID=761193 RepID=A0A7U4E3W9_RUNSL|nr:TonB-dependent receptor [Runella slithyformis]AEI46469.1 TonB-dependent receptor [Runella slithyformis DSM 19594]